MYVVEHTFSQKNFFLSNCCIWKTALHESFWQIFQFMNLFHKEATFDDNVDDDDESGAEFVKV